MKNSRDLIRGEVVYIAIMSQLHPRFLTLFIEMVTILKFWSHDWWKPRIHTERFPQIPLSLLRRGERETNSHAESVTLFRSIVLLCQQSPHIIKGIHEVLRLLTFNFTMRSFLALFHLRKVVRLFFSWRGRGSKNSLPEWNLLSDMLFVRGYPAPRTGLKIFIKNHSKEIEFQ